MATRPKLDETLTPQEAINALYDRVENEQEEFDKYLQRAVDTDCESEFIESYLNLRDSGLDFRDAYMTAAEEREIELEDEEEKKDS